MNDQTPMPEGEPPEAQIVLVDVADKHYLIQGEEFLEDLMIVDGTFPSPVRCVKFETVLDLNTFTDGAASLADLWVIHPEIIKRLRKDGHLLEIDAA